MSSGVSGAQSDIVRSRTDLKRSERVACDGIWLIVLMALFVRFLVKVYDSTSLPEIRETARS